MSTVDPVAARRERAARVPSIPVVVLVWVLQALGGAAAGFGIGSLILSEDDPNPLLVIPALGGVLLTVVASAVWLSFLRRRPGLGMGAGQAAVLLGAGGAVLAIAVHAGEPTAPTIVGAVLLGLGVVAGVLGLLAARARRRGGDRNAEAMRTGTETEATVTDQGWTAFTESTRILTTVTFSFTDLQGVQRWVQRPMVIRAEAPLVNGDRTRLWYAPTDPGDDRRIAVEAAMASPLRPGG